MQGENVGTVTCPSCGAMLVAGLRFCRRCGYRLGEGVEEYMPTQRLDPAAPPAATAAPSAGTDPFAPRPAWGVGPIQPMQPIQPFGGMAQGAPAFGLANARSPKRGGWWVWLVLVVILLSAGGIVPFAIRNSRGGGTASAPAPRSFLGVDGLESAAGGALIVGIAAPETPVVRAGLIGGDIITGFDGKPVKDAEAMRRILGETPVGKTVEVTYIRDGAAGKTMLTTIAEKDNPGLKLFDRRPGGRGDIGISRRDLDRVSVPGMNIYGVELGDINRNGPADLAGLREGDIVIEFNESLIRTEGDLRYRIFEATPGNTVKAVVVRGGERIEVPVKVGRSRD